jgi:hypothetical protein
MVVGGFRIFLGLLLLVIEIKIFLLVNMNISWLIMFVAQFCETDCRCAFVLVTPGKLLCALYSKTSKTEIGWPLVHCRLRLA